MTTTFCFQASAQAQSCGHVKTASVEVGIVNQTKRYPSRETRCPGIAGKHAKNESEPWNSPPFVNIEELRRFDTYTGAQADSAIRARQAGFILNVKIMEMMIKPDQFNQLIQQRRSVFSKDYTGERVKDEIVTQMLENARWAPTHKLTEPWRFLVFTGDGIRALARVQSDLYKTVAEQNGTFDERNYQKLLTKPLLSSHIIAVIMKRDDRKSVPEIEEAGAVFCAVQNMYLTAAAYGVGCYLSTGGVTYLEEAKDHFGLEPDDRIIGFFHLGIPKKKYPAGRRKPLEEVCHWVTTD